MFRFSFLCALFMSQVAFGSLFKNVPVQMNDGSITTISVYEAALRQGVPKIPLDTATQYFEANITKFANRNYLTIIDYSVHSANERMYLIDLKTGKVEKLHVSHGRGSDPQHTGTAKKFSNLASSHMTSLGFFMASETYSGKHGYSLRLDGLSSTNSNARARAIVIHGASYVKQGLAKMGRSLGCPAVDNNLSKGLIDKIKNGSLILSYSL